MYHGKKTRARKKRRSLQGGVFTETTVGEPQRKKAQTKGGGTKERLVEGRYVNVSVDGRPLKCEVTGLEENPANKDYTRRKIITRGAVLDVKAPDGRELKARVTSRPGQHGALNAVALE